MLPHLKSFKEVLTVVDVIDVSDSDGDVDAKGGLEDEEEDQTQVKHLHIFTVFEFDNISIYI